MLTILSHAVTRTVHEQEDTVDLQRQLLIFLLQIVVVPVQLFLVTAREMPDVLIFDPEHLSHGDDLVHISFGRW